MGVTLPCRERVYFESLISPEIGREKNAIICIVTAKLKEIELYNFKEIEYNTYYVLQHTIRQLFLF